MKKPIEFIPITQGNNVTSILGTSMIREDCTVTQEEERPALLDDSLPFCIKYAEKYEKSLDSCF